MCFRKSCRHCPPRNHHVCGIPGSGDKNIDFKKKIVRMRDYTKWSNESKTEKQIRLDDSMFVKVTEEKPSIVCNIQQQLGQSYLENKSVIYASSY